jgi:hypothetical protein
MPKILIGTAAVLCLLILEPQGSAAQDVALDYQQIERVRIELLERGFNPGFESELNEQAIDQLNEALRQFQAEYRLPVTGQVDVSTIAALSVPTPSVGKAEPEVRRAKPSGKGRKSSN